MDMEWSESRYEHNQDSRFERSSPDAVYREEKMDDFEDGVGTVIATKDKEKSRDSGKHRSKDRKKERREEKGHGSKDRERAKIDLLKESEENQNELRENDHVGSRERRKEEHKENNKAKIREKDHGKDKEREKEHERTRDKGKDWERDRELEDRSLEREYKRGREREKDKDRERDRDREKEQERNKGRERDREKELEKDNEREKDRDREREKDRDRAKDREREREKVKDRDREREKEKYKDRDRLERDKGREKTREKEKEKDRDRKLEKEKEKDRDRKLEKDLEDKEKARERERDKMIGKNRDQGYDKEMLRSKDGERDEKLKLDYEDTRDITMQVKEVQNGEGDNPEKLSTRDHKQRTESTADGSHPPTSDLESRIRKMKEERLKKKSVGVSEVLAWVSKSRKVEEKLNAEKVKALHLSKVFEEQDNVDQGESDDEEVPQHPTKDLAGVKILHGLDKVIEGGAVVLTLRDQNILTDGDINEEADMLENVEIGEQKRRDEAYKAAKKKTGTYDDKFNEDPGSQKRILPQYDDPADEEGVTLDGSGHFSGEAEKKLEELRRRIQGAPVSNQFQDLTTTGKLSSDYYTHEEMVQFKKPSKKKKSLRKREKLDLDALEAEAISAGLGAGDLGFRNEERRQSAKAEEERVEADMRTEAYQAAYAKAQEASKALRQEQTLTIQPEEDENLVFGGDDEDLYKSLEKARKLALKRQDEAGASGMQLVAGLAETNNESEETQNHVSGGIVITEMEEFVSKIHLDEEIHKPEADDVFKDEEVPKSFEKEMEDEAGGWTEVKDTGADELPTNEEKEDLVPDKIIHETAVGKGLSGALQLLKERGTLKETIDWGGRNMDKKKSKLVGIYENDGTKEIHIERTDEFGRIMTPKEAFRIISHKFHGKGPGKMKLEKKIKKYQEELKSKQMKASDTPSESMERMREAQARLKTPYLVLSGHVKPGQTSDPRSGFATVEKDHPGSLTPMLGDRKVEHFLGIKRKAEPSSMGPPKKQKE